MKILSKNDFVEKELMLMKNKISPKKIKKIELDDMTEFVEMPIFSSFSDKSKLEQKKCGTRKSSMCMFENHLLRLCGNLKEKRQIQ